MPLMKMNPSSSSTVGVAVAYCIVGALIAYLHSIYYSAYAPPSYNIRLHMLLFGAFVVSIIVIESLRSGRKPSLLRLVVGLIFVFAAVSAAQYFRPLWFYVLIICVIALAAIVRSGRRASNTSPD
jgi:hypothetical protein